MYIENQIKNWDEKIDLKIASFEDKTEEELINILQKSIGKWCSAYVIEIYDKLIELNPDKIKFYNKKIDEELNKIKEELNKIEDEDVADGKGMRYYFLKSDLLQHMHRYTEAIEHCNKAIEYFKKWEEPPITIKHLLSESGFYRENIEYLKELPVHEKKIKLHPNVKNYVNMAKCLEKQGLLYSENNKMPRILFKKAILCYSKAIELEPNNITHYLSKAKLLDSINRSKEAVECYSKAIELEPNNITHYISKAKLLHIIGNPLEVINCYTEIELYGEVQNYWDKINFTPYLLEYLKTGELPNYWDKKEELSSSKKNTTTGQLKESVKYSLRSDALWNELRLSYDGKNQIYLQKNNETIIFQGDIICAWRIYTLLSSIEGNVIEFKYDDTNMQEMELLKIYLKVAHGLRYRKDKSRCGTPALMNSIASEEDYQKAVAFERKEKYSEAIASYNNAITLDPSQADYYAGKAFCLKALGQYEEAMKCYDIAIELEPDTADYYEGKAFCLRLLKD